MPLPQDRARLVWVDVAKGVAISLVVLHHVVLFATAATWVPEIVTTVNAQVATVRMPLFFLASGLFAGSALRKPWAVVLRKRILLFVYLYLLWTVVRFLLFQIIPDVRSNALDGDLHALLLSPLRPGTGLWFIYALAVFSTAAKLSLRAPASLQLLMAAVLASLVGSETFSVGNFAWRNMAMYYVFFLLGMHHRRLVERFAGRVGPVSALVLMLATSAATYTVYQTGLKGVPGVWLLLSLVAVAFGISFSALIARTSWMARKVATLGQKTLPIYLIHVPVVAVLVAALDEVVAPAGEAGTALLPIIAVAAAAISLSLHLPLKKVAPWMFAPPLGRRTAPSA